MFKFLRKSKRRKVLVIGIDCGAPQLVFDMWRDQLPNLRRLMENGIYGELMSCIPAITVPAWSCMFSSKDPSVLGFYGFRNRANYTYDKMSIATGTAMKGEGERPPRRCPSPDGCSANATQCLWIAHSAGHAGDHH